MVSTIERRTQTIGRCRCAQINCKGGQTGLLVALNGTAAIALLTFSSAVTDNENLQDAAFIGILVLVAGLVLAVLYNIFRRKCSAAYQAGLGEHGVPCICRLGHICQALSLVLFLGGAVCVPVAHRVLDNGDDREATVE